MGDFEKVEDRIKEEWNAVRALFATNQTVTLLVYGGLCFLAGAVLF